jgi:hypothetical protein
VILAGVLGLAAIAPGHAQKPADRAPKMVTGPDVAVIKAAAETLRQPGECMVEFTVGVDGKPKDMKPNCTPEAYNEYAVKAMATVEYLPEIFAGEVFETEGFKQPFKFGVTATTVAKAPGDTPPVKTKDIDARAVQRAMQAVDKAGSCNAEFTVAADGSVKDIVPGCTPADYDKPISEALAKMKYKPGENAGKAIDWPKMQMPLNLSKKK